MKIWTIGLLAVLLSVVTYAYTAPIKWLIYPVRDSLETSTEVDVYQLVYKGGKAINVQALPASPFSPQIELYDGLGNLIGADYTQPGDIQGSITMPVGGTVTNILYLYITGKDAVAYPVYYKAWLGLP